MRGTSGAMNGAASTATMAQCQTRWRVEGAARRSSAAITVAAIKMADVLASNSSVITGLLSALDR
jgi:hypothetical protein